jgi:prepilin-type N-terminal cleavage/methylation domain-containing protein
MNPINNNLPVKRKSICGFTLVEMAVVLVIVALLLAAALGPLATRIEAGERQDAQDELADIKEAIYGFAVTSGRLPCPDTDNDGVENVAAGACVAENGSLPWQTLGSPQQDPGGSAYVYRVTATFADNPPSGTSAPLCPTAAAQAAFNLCDVGNVTVDDETPGGTVLAQNVPAVILSSGANHNDPNFALGGTLSAFETENSDGDAVFVSKTFSRDDTEEFDDLVVWISPNVLKNRMVVAGRLP